MKKEMYRRPRSNCERAGAWKSSYVYEGSEGK